jgi:hypothetical protein
VSDGEQQLLPDFLPWNSIVGSQHVSVPGNANLPYPSDSVAGVQHVSLQHVSVPSTVVFPFVFSLIFCFCIPYCLETKIFKLAGVKGCTKCKYGNYWEIGITNKQF